MMSTAIYTYSARSFPRARDRQQAECEALARELDPTVTQTYHDEAGARFALEQLVAGTRDHKVSKLVIAGLDRLGRTFGTFTRVMEALHHVGVTVYVVGHGELHTSDSQILAITRAIADFEYEHAQDITR